MGNQFVDLLWSSGERLGQAETKIKETKEGVMIEFHSRVVTGEKLEGKIGGRKLLLVEEHAGFVSDWD